MRPAAKLSIALAVSALSSLAIALAAYRAQAGFEVEPPVVDATEADSDEDGVVDEIDDAPLDPERAFEVFYPARRTTGRLAFEDGWPELSDFDFNDLVVAYRFNTIRDAAGALREIRASLEIMAIGTETALGFGIELPFAQGTALDSATLQLDEDPPIPVSAEPGQDRLVFVVWSDVLDTRNARPFFNTDGEPLSPGSQVELRLVFATPPSPVGNERPPFNPFVFQSGVPGYETHLPNHAPTSQADPGVLGSLDDDSRPEDGRTYLSAENLPWALDIPAAWSHPREGVDLVRAYPDLVEWVESAGTVRRDWYLSPSSDDVIHP